MKKVKIQFTVTQKNGARKEIKVWLDENIYAVLHETQNQALLETYIFAFCAVLCYNTPMRRGYRILSVEAADIYKNEQKNGAVVGYRLPEKGDARFRLFKILLDDSLDSKELEKAYTRICRANGDRTPEASIVD